MGPGANYPLPPSINVGDRLALSGPRRQSALAAPSTLPRSPPAASERLRPRPFITLKSGAPMGRAGLWENWKDPQGNWLRTFTIITGEPNKLVAPIHHRMPVILRLNAPARERLEQERGSGPGACPVVRTAWPERLGCGPSVMTIGSAARPSGPLVGYRTGLISATSQVCIGANAGHFKEVSRPAEMWGTSCRKGRRHLP